MNKIDKTSSVYFICFADDVEMGVEDQKMSNQATIFTINDHCLIEILDKLEFIDLINIGAVDVRFQNLIRKHIIGQKDLDFGEIYTKTCVRNALKLFGSQIRKLKISDTHVQYNAEAPTAAQTLVELLKTYCSGGKLEELDITLTTREFTEESLEALGPALNNLQILKINSYSFNALINCLKHTQNLRELSFKGAHFASTDLGVPLNRLRKLEIKDCYFPQNQDRGLESLLSQTPHLKSFIYRTSLYHFDVSAGNPLRFLTLIPELEELEISFGYYTSFNTSSYNEILNLNKLRSLKIISTSADNSDISEFMKQLSRKNTVRRLTIKTSRISTGFRPFQEIQNNASTEFSKFASLIHLHIINPTKRNHAFLQKLIGAAPNLGQINIESQQNITQSFVLDYVTNAKKLSFLKLDTPKNNISDYFYKNMWRAKSNASRCLELCVGRKEKEAFFQRNGVYNERVLKITSFKDKPEKLRYNHFYGIF